MTIHAPVPSGGDDTATIQALMNGATTGETLVFQPQYYRINPSTGLRIPKAMTLDLRGTTLYIDANATNKNRMIETIPGVSGLRILGGEIRGSLVPVTNLQFSIGLRVDSASDVVVDGTAFRDWYTDGAWIGGNTATPSVNVRFTGITTENCRRNGMSISNVVGVTIERSTFRASTGDPGAGIDVEPNVGDTAMNVSIYNSLFEGNRVGLYLQRGLGLQGENYKVVDCTIRGSLLFGLAISSINKLVIANTRVEASAPTSDVGASFGGGTDIMLAFNYARGSNHDFRYSGVGNISILGNDGRITVVTPGFLGRVSIQ